MPGRKEFLIVSVVALLVLPFLADYLWAQQRLAVVTIETVVSPQKVVADGKQTGVVTLRVTENGKPRADDLVQAWLTVGNGLLTPQWFYTDHDGRATVSFTPNALTQYEVQDRAEIHIKDINIGRLIEVGKEVAVVMSLSVPEEPSQKPGNMSFGQ